MPPALIRLVPYSSSYTLVITIQSLLYMYIPRHTCSHQLLPQSTTGQCQCVLSQWQLGVVTFHTTERKLKIVYSYHQECMNQSMKLSPVSGTITIL